MMKKIINAIIILSIIFTPLFSFFEANLTLTKDNELLADSAVYSIYDPIYSVEKLEELAAKYLHMLGVSSKDYTLSFYPEDTPTMVMITFNNRSAVKWERLLDYTADNSSFTMNMGGLKNLFEKEEVAKEFDLTALKLSISFQNPVEASDTYEAKSGDNTYTWKLSYSQINEGKTINVFFDADTTSVEPNVAVKREPPFNKDIIKTLRVLLRKGKTNEAKSLIDRTDFQTADSYVDLGELYHFKGVTYYLISDYNSPELSIAASSFKKAHEITGKPHVRVYSLLWLGMLYENYTYTKTNLTRGMKWLDQIIEDFPNSDLHNDAVLYKALIYEKMGKSVETKALINYLKSGSFSDSKVFSKWDNEYISVNSAVRKFYKYGTWIPGKGISGKYYEFQNGKLKPGGNVLTFNSDGTFIIKNKNNPQGVAGEYSFDGDMTIKAEYLGAPVVIKVSRSGGLRWTFGKGKDFRRF